MANENNSSDPPGKELMKMLEAAKNRKNTNSPGRLQKRWGKALDKRNKKNKKNKIIEEQGSKKQE